MKFLSVCAGIEAASVAWHPLGMECVGHSEIEKFPCAALAHHYPDVVQLGDMTRHEEWNIERPDILVGGTPCQSFSVAGLRKGMADPRGNLALTYLAIADQFRPDWLVWENVPGVLSSNGGRDFGAFLGGLVELGYGFAYRVLDAQYFGVPQRRRRVFVVGHTGDWQRAAAVLFERESLRRNPAPSREKGERIAPPIAGCANGGGANGPGRTADDAEALIAFQQNTRDEVRLMGGDGKIAGALAVEPGMKQQNYVVACDIADTLSVGANQTTGFKADICADNMQVRRLTPVECERLQGFPDNYTRIPWRGKPAEQCPDGPRYKALGNSMAVPVMRWIGERLIEVDKL